MGATRFAPRGGTGPSASTETFGAAGWERPKMTGGSSRGLQATYPRVREPVLEEDRATGWGQRASACFPGRTPGRSFYRLPVQLSLWVTDIFPYEKSP